MDTKKERFIKILKRVLIGLSIGLNVFFLIAMIIGGASVKKQSNKLNKFDNVSENVNFIKENKRLVTYDDSTYSIILSGNEFNNYTWVNLNRYLYEDSDNLAYYIHDSELLTKSDGYIRFVIEGFVYFNFSADLNENVDNNKFNISSSETPITESYTLYCDSTNYAGLKHVIELDIQANSATMTDGIFETLTESTVSFIGTLGSGIVAMTSVFYDSANSQLTTIGLLSVIVVAVSLSYFLFRLIIGLIRMRG